MILDYLFLPMLFFIGLITSYQDIKYGKVKNIWILVGLAWSGAIIFSLIIWSLIAQPVTRYIYYRVLNYPADFPATAFTVNLDFLLETLLNSVIALTIAYLMWRYNAWAAGDAKLFFVYTLLIPLTYYWKSYLPIFPSLVLLINIFIPIFLYLFIKSVFYNTRFFLSWFYRYLFDRSTVRIKAKPKKKINFKRFFSNLKSMGALLLGFVLIFLALRLFQEPIRQSTNIDIFSLQIIFFPALIIFSGTLGKFFAKKIIFFFTLLALIALLLYGFTVSVDATLDTFFGVLKMMAAFIVILGIFRKMIEFYVHKNDIVAINIDQLKARMSLTEASVSLLMQDKKFFEDKIGQIYVGGLTEDQAQAAQKWLVNNQAINKQKITIYKPFPFVTWMFIGVIVTLILKSSLIYIIVKSLFNLS